MGKSGNAVAILRRRIRSRNLGDSVDPGSVADELKENYPDYSRHSRKTLIVSIKRALDSIRRDNGNYDGDSADTAEGQACNSRRRLARSDDSERRLASKEFDHIRRRRAKHRPSASDNSTSTSDDVVFEQKFEPEYDVTASLLRNNYSLQSKKQRLDDVADGVNMEIEVADNKQKRTVEVVNVLKTPVEAPVTRRESGGGGDAGGEGPRFKDLGGMQGVLDELMMEVIVPLCYPELPRWLGVRPMAGILLHGPPGCGKTKLAHAIANETGVPFYKISATEVVSGVSGASEENIRDLFKKAYRTAPSIVFIDEIDAIASKRENLQREMERRIVTQLMTCMDELHQTLKSVDADTELEETKRKPGYVLVIGATNRPDAVDQALRRPGRFDREIILGVPDENARVQILSVLTHNLRLDGKFDLFKIARSTPGFVGADLAALANKAGNLAMKRIIDRRKSELCKEHNDKNTDWWRQAWTAEEMESLSINMADFEEAAKMVQPSSRREGFSSIPNVKWEDVGGLNSLREEFERYIVQRIKNPEDYEDFGVNLEVGFLLYGPPGCGKTLIAKAVANEAGANFIHIKGPELLNKYVGESELAVRTIFTRARTCSPCILFFDEVDALTTKRGQDGGWVVERLLNQLLIELDGSDQRQGVYVIGATNRLEVIDRAVLRPGRFGKKLYVPLPNADERGLILKALAQKKPISDDVDLDAIARRAACNNLSGADLAALMNEAAMAAMEERQKSLHLAGSSTEPRVIKTSHFEKALGKVTPSVSEKQRSYYEALSQKEKVEGRT